jgi:H+-transporting ATPase
VKRDGKWVNLAVRELCVGDVIELKGGDVIPADALVRLVRSAT